MAALDGLTAARPTPPAPPTPSAPPSSLPTLAPSDRERLADCAEAAHRSGRPDVEALTVLRETGLLGAAVPAAYGGASADAEDLNSLVADVAYANASASIMLFQHYAVSARIVEHGSAEQRAELLPRLASGSWLAASAWSETGAGADKKKLSTTARRTGDGWLLDGAKSFTTSAGLADVYLVLAQSGAPDDADDGADAAYGADGQTFFLVPGANSGLVPDTSMRLSGMRGSATGFVSVRNCHLPDSARLGPEGVAASIIAGVRESGASLGAVAVGVAQAALDAAHRHAERRGLLGHQAVRHRLVDLATRVEAARASVERAGRRSAPEPGMATLHSKLFAATTGESVVADVERMLGSAGYVETHPINRYAHDVRAVALMGPTNELCKELVSLPWTR